jgi:hypothetical protein
MCAVAADYHKRHVPCCVLLASGSLFLMPSAHQAVASCCTFANWTEQQAARQTF